MKIGLFIVSFIIISCNRKPETKEQESNKTETSRSHHESSKIYGAEQFLSEFKSDVKDLNALIQHVRFVLSADCAYLMMLNEEKEFYEEADFKKYYSQIFPAEVIDKIQQLKPSEVQVNKDDEGEIIGFQIQLNFSEYQKENNWKEEWGLGLQFVVEDGSYKLICMQGAG